MSESYLKNAVEKAQEEALKSLKPEAVKQKPKIGPKLSAAQQKSTAYSKKKATLLKKMKGNKEKVVTGWLETDPKGGERLKMSPKFEAYRYFKDQDYQKYAFTMLALIENHWGIDKVNEVWGKIKNEYFSGDYKWNKEKGAYEALRAFFSKENAAKKIGIYFGEKRKTKKWALENGKRLKLKHYGKYNPIAVDDSNSPYCKWKLPKGSTWGQTYPHVTGWWTYDEDPGSSDEFTFATSINGAISKIKSELTPKKKAEYDSGIDPEEAAKVVKTLEAANKYPKPRVGTLRRELLAHFIKKPKKGKDASIAYSTRWTKLENSEILTKLSLVYSGLDFTQYKFRYFPKQKKIAFIRLNSAPKDDMKFGGFLEFKEGRLSEKIKVLSKAAFLKTIKKEVLNKMSVEEVRANLVQHEVEHSAAPSRASMLAVSKNRIAAIYRKHKTSLQYIKSSDLQTAFYDKIERLLKNDLLKSKKALTENDAVKYAAIRVEELKKTLSKKLEEVQLKEYLEKNTKAALQIVIDSTESITVSPRNKKRWNKFKGGLLDAAKAVAKKGNDIASLAKDQYDALMGKMGFVGKLFDKYFNFQKSIFEYFKTGKKSWALSIAGLATGAEVSRRALNASAVTSLAELKKLSKKNGGVTKKRLRFKENVKLAGYKIVIPKGKGVRPGGKFRVRLKGVANAVDADPRKVKRQASIQRKGIGILAGLFSGKVKGKKLNMFKDNEITIAANTEIPAKTYIPKGAKIVKV